MLRFHVDMFRYLLRLKKEITFVSITGVDFSKSSVICMSWNVKKLYNIYVRTLLKVYEFVCQEAIKYMSEHY